MKGEDAPDAQPPLTDPPKLGFLLFEAGLAVVALFLLAMWLVPYILN